MEVRVCIDLGASKANIGVLDASGTILARARLDIREAKTDSGKALRLICGEVDRLLAAMGFPPARAEFIGMGIVNIVNLFSPNVVILSRGLCAQEELLIVPVREYVLSRAYSVAAKALRVVKAQLGEDAPMVGAGLLDRGSVR